MTPTIARGSLFPAVQRASSYPGTVLGHYIQAFLPGKTGYATFGEAGVKTGLVLPAGASAAGIRPGVCNMLAARGDAHRVRHRPDGPRPRPAHRLRLVLRRRAGALYAGSRRAREVARLPVWGQLGMGPKPATLAALEPLGVSADALQSSILTLLRITKAAYPFLQPLAPLWPMVQAVFATLLMYYEECFNAGEMSLLLRKMKTVIANEYGAGDQAHDQLIKWSRALKECFRLDNLHLTARSTGDGPNQVVAAVGGVSGTVAQLGQTLQAVHAQMLLQAQQMEAMAAESLSGCAVSLRPTPPPPSLSAAAPCGSRLACSKCGRRQHAARQPPEPTRLVRSASGCGRASLLRPRLRPRRCAAAVARLVGGVVVSVGFAHAVHAGSVAGA